MSRWIEHAIFWQVYPLGFVGVEPARPPVRRLRELAGWLDYAVELGVSGVALGPIFASHSHGYDTVDHLRIDPRLGDDSDFDALIEAARSRGLRVLLDGVFNHVGRGFGRLEEFALHTADGLATFEGHDALVTLDHSRQQVRDYVAEVMTHWLDRGAGGWRLDAAYAVPTDFWADVLPRVRRAHPDCYLVGEVIHGDYAEIVQASTLDSVTQYELWKAIWSSINDVNLHELAWALQRHNEFLDTFVPLTFVGNHDVTRISSMLTDSRHLPHALAVLFAVGGTPAVYYGDEQAMRGLKQERAGGDDEVRPKFPDAPGDLPADGWSTYRLHQDLIGLRRRHPWLHTARTTAVELTGGNALFESRSGDQMLQLAVNLQDQPTPLPATGTVLLGSVTDRGPRTLPPHGWAILQP